jgi:hypothetical protein
MIKGESTNINEWLSPEHALAYLAKSDAIPHRTEGESVVLEFLHWHQAPSAPPALNIDV